MIEANIGIRIGERYPLRGILRLFFEELVMKPATL